MIDTEIVTKVVRVNGKSPSEWLADDGNRYVGRRVFLRSGRHEGEIWPNTGFGNEHKFVEDDTDAERKIKLYRYTVALSESCSKHAFARSAFKELRGKLLGCWCFEWNGKGDFIPNCHACWLARIVDVIAASGIVCVTHEGKIVSAERDVKTESDRYLVIQSSPGKFDYKEVKV